MSPQCIALALQSLPVIAAMAWIVWALWHEAERGE